MPLTEDLSADRPSCSPTFRDGGTARESDETGWGTMLVWTLVLGAIDNVLRPILIRKGCADLPMPLIIAGLIGFGIASARSFSDIGS